MDSSTYGSMVEHGGPATGGLVGECGPELVRVGKGESVSTSTGMRATYALLPMRRIPGAGGTFAPVAGFNWLDPDDGCAGVPAKV
jgi:hypothetical protein